MKVKEKLNERTCGLVASKEDNGAGIVLLSVESICRCKTEKLLRSCHEAK